MSKGAPVRAQQESPTGASFETPGFASLLKFHEGVDSGRGLCQSEAATTSLWRGTMTEIEDKEAAAQSAIRVNIGAIFVSMELSRSTWLVTSLSPGAGEKMSRHSLEAGDL